MPSKQDLMEFEQTIETMVSDMGINHIEAIVEYCESRSIEVEVITSLISKSLKSKLTLTAQSLNYLPKKGKLPI